MVEDDDVLVECRRLVRGALERLDHRERWTKGAWARDRAGVGVHPRSAEAVQFCVAGALLRTQPDLPPLLRRLVIEAFFARRPALRLAFELVSVSLLEQIAERVLDEEPALAPAGEDAEFDLQTELRRLLPACNDATVTRYEDVRDALERTHAHLDLTIAALEAEGNRDAGEDG